MQSTTRHFLILSTHRRFQRLWQFFFTGWGLVMIASLAAAPIFSKNLIWTPISAIDMTEIQMNQFKMQNASFAGTDTHEKPFHIKAGVAYQTFESADKVLMEKVWANIIRIENNKEIHDIITANSAIFEKSTNTLNLIDNVRVNSSNGDKILTDEMVIKL